MATSITANLTDANKTVLDRLEKDETSNALKQKQSMGQEQFLHLITEQLKYQDPMSPMKDEQFISQMAQLESLQSQNSTLDLMKQSYLMNVNMNTTLASMNDNIKKLVDQMASTSGTKVSDSSGVTNKDIVNELIKMNKSLDTYFNK